MENNFITRVRDLTGIDAEAIQKKIIDLDVDSMLDLLGTLADGDQERAIAILAIDEPEEAVVSEGVIGGMTCIQDLARLQTLAGLQASFSPEPVVPAETEIEILPTRLQPVYASAELDFDGILDAFERIERSVGDLRIKDAKAVRERIQRLVGRLNESSMVRKRKI